MKREGKTLRIPAKLVFAVLHFAVAGALGCGHDTAPADAGVQDASTLVDLNPNGVDACSTIYCGPDVAGAQCPGLICVLQDCPEGCAPYT